MTPIDSAITPHPGSSETQSGQQPGPQIIFDGPRRPLFWLLIRNLALTIVTIGIYRFWAKTRVRRFFWRHTKLLGEPVEYLGTGGELFVGFLIAIVILVPLGATYSLLQFFTIGVQGYVPLMVDIAYYTVLAFLIQIAIHRMRRYRLTRTAWRGVRFGLDGSAVRYALISFGWGIVTLLTLGLAHPWLRIATMRYFFNNARFGASTISLDASARWLFSRWLVVTVPFAVAIVLFAALNWSLFHEFLLLNDEAQQGAEVSGQLSAAVDRINYWPLTLTAISFVVGIWYSVIEFRYLLSHVRLGDIVLKSEITPAFVYRVYLLFWSAILLFILGACVLLVLISHSIGGVNEVPGAAASGVILLGLVLVFFFYGILRTLFVDVTLLKRACATLTVSNPAALDAVVQASADLPSHGEGLADALDVGGF